MLLAVLCILVRPELKNVPWDPALLEHWCLDKKKRGKLFRNKTSSPFESKK